MQSQFLNHINDIAAEHWNQLAGTDYPFLRHEFLQALENSGVVDSNNGWQPQHLLLFDADELIAACPLYLKTHSQGEFVFDQQWANAYQQQGLAYYPKGLTAIPFTPCPDRRFLIKADREPAEIIPALIAALQQHLLSLAIGSWHCLFTDLEQTEQLRSAGLLIREGVQFQWFNQQYRDFQDYVAQFNSRKRKTTLRERRQVREQGIHFLCLRGNAISQQQWQIFFRFYQMTYFKHGRPGYLNLAFFNQLAHTMPEQLLLIFALKEERYIGAALSFVGTDSLYGRYWGCLEEYAFLHFEACYYQGLEFCIANGLQRFDSGAQGEHKIARGFQPVTTYSAHWIHHPAFANAIANFLTREKTVIQQYKKDAAALLPFKHPAAL